MVVVPEASAGGVDGDRLVSVFQRLLDRYGRQHWWPADDIFEVMVGAILTQNTAWTNVEQALARLRHRCLLTPQAMSSVPAAELANSIRPSGYYNVKARRLQNYCRWYLAAGGYAALEQWPDGRLREALLGVNGIGAETADAILLYAFQRPVFVVDRYTCRLFSRLGMIADDSRYEMVQAFFHDRLGGSRGRRTALYNEYHALIVMHGKHCCRARQPRCRACPLAEQCPLAGIV